MIFEATDFGEAGGGVAVGGQLGAAAHHCDVAVQRGRRPAPQREPEAATAGCNVQRPVVLHAGQRPRGAAGGHVEITEKINELCTFTDGPDCYSFVKALGWLYFGGWETTHARL